MRGPQQISQSKGDRHGARSNAIDECAAPVRAIDTETGEINPKAPFMVNSRRRGFRANRPYEDEPGVIDQFRPGECQAQFEAVWNEETGDWIFGRRVDDA
jgi:hypothetical protein